MIEIHNLPDKPKRYIVAQYCMDEGYWFWGSYDNEEDARYVARDVGGEVFDDLVYCVIPQISKADEMEVHL